MALFFRPLRRRFRTPSASMSNPRSTAPSPRARRARSAAPVRKLYGIPAYMLVVDESGSTAQSLRFASGRTTTRIRAIQMAAHDYLRHLQASNARQRVGLVGFSNQAVLHHRLAPVGRTLFGLCRALRRLHPQSATNLSAGLALALTQLQRARIRHANIVVITDGASNMETRRLPELTRQARMSRVRIFTIGVGNNGDFDYDRHLLTRLARATGGRFMSAHSFQALCNALRKAC